MKKPQIVHQPYYPGGKTAMGTYLQKNLAYPKAALDAAVEGTVHLRYDIDHKGRVVGTEILHGIGYGCDEEAERLVRGMEFTIPKKARGMRIIYHKNLKVNFHLPKTKAAPTKPVAAAAPPTAPQVSAVNYTITGTSEGGSYTYQINMPEEE